MRTRDIDFIHLTRRTWESDSVRTSQDGQIKAKCDAAEGMAMRSPLDSWVSVLFHWL